MKKTCINKFRKIYYPLQFINNIVNDVLKLTKDLEDSYIIPSNLFKEQKPFILIEIPFYDRNEKSQETLLYVL